MVWQIRSSVCYLFFRTDNRFACVVLIRCMPDLFLHVINPCRLSLKDSVSLGMIVPHIIEYRGSHEPYDGKIQIT